MTFARCALSCVCLALTASGCAAAKTAKAPVPVAQSNTCITPAQIVLAKKVGGIQLRPHPRGGVYLCIAEPQTLFPAPPSHCWRLDLQGRLRTSTTPAPAANKIIRLGKDRERWQFVSTDGLHRAVSVVGEYNSQQSIHVENARTGKRASPDLLAGGPVKNKRGGPEPDANVESAHFVNDTILLRDADSGPHEDVIAYSIDGKVKKVLIPEMTGGTISVIDPYRVAITQYSVDVIEIYDTRTRRLTMYKRRVPPTPACTTAMEEYTVCSEDGAAEKHCCAQLKRRDIWTGSVIAPLSAGRFAIIATDKRFGVMGIFDPNKRAITKTVKLTCGPR